MELSDLISRSPRWVRQASPKARDLARAALNTLFPPRCAVGNTEGQFLHDTCEDKLPRLNKPYCSLCANPGTPRVCSWCAATAPAFDAISAPYLMEGPVTDLVHGLKYENLRASAPELGRLLAGHLKPQARAADLLIPVPLHGRRERERGYNQSALLAREVGGSTGIPVVDEALERTKNTPPQVSIAGHEDRRQNIEGAFECLGGVEDRRVLLIDDVVTTGSTMDACAKALKEAGATRVWGLALARQA